MENLNICPYCSKENFVPSVAYQNVQAYDSSWCRFKCTKCKGKVKLYIRRICVVDINTITKTTEDLDW
jgi:hypothetical protein